MDKTWFNLFKEVSKELGLNLTPVEIQDIFNFQFKFMNDVYSKHNTTEENRLPTILIPEVGRFYSKRRKEKKRIEGKQITDEQYREANKNKFKSKNNENTIK
jgi:hypothetical protein